MPLSRSLSLLSVAAAIALAAQAAFPQAAKARPAAAAQVGTASAVRAGGGGSPPSVIRLCDADNPGWCWTYTRNGDHYDGVGERGGRRTMTLESFTSESVVMRMTQEGRPGWSSVNSGKMSSEGGSLTAGVWSDNNGGKGHITATWTAESTQAAASPAKTAASTKTTASTKTSTPAKSPTAKPPAKPTSTARSGTASQEAKPSAANSPATKPVTKLVTKPVVKPAQAEPEK